MGGSNGTPALILIKDARKPLQARRRSSLSAFFSRGCKVSCAGIKDLVSGLDWHVNIVALDRSSDDARDLRLGT
jgi:hypothetical protein